MAKKSLSPHAASRLVERYEGCSPKELDKAINTRNNVQFVRRLTTTRSLAYVRLSTGIVKCIINRQRNLCVTVLPWQDRYQAKIELVINDIQYHVTLYPDAYKETEASNCLTLVQQIFHEHTTMGDDKVCAQMIGPGTSKFTNIFEAAWTKYIQEGGGCDVGQG